MSLKSKCILRHSIVLGTLLFPVWSLCCLGQELHFSNGDKLAGHPIQFSKDQKLTWKSTTLESELSLPLKKLDSIDFRKEYQGHQKNSSDTITAKMHRGDSYTGSIIALDEKSLTLKTSWAQQVKVDRRFISKIIPSIYRENLLGNPYDLTHWHTVNNREKWRSSDETITCRKRSAMCKKVNYPQKFKFSTKITIRNAPRLRLMFLASEGNVYEPEDYIELSIQRNSILARGKVDGEIETIGQANGLDELYENTSHNVEFYCNTQDYNMHVFLNSKQVAQWALPVDLTIHPWLYFTSDYDGEISLSKCTVEEWNGIVPISSETLSTVIPKPSQTMVHLQNGDIIDAKDVAFDAPHFRIITDLGQIQVKQHKIDNIDFGGSVYQEAKRESNDISIDFINGNSATLKLEKWNNGYLHGWSQNLGSVKIAQDQIQFLNFNIY